MTTLDDRAAEVPGTFDEAAVAALSVWVRERGIGSAVSDVEPLAGGTQNVVVRLRRDVPEVAAFVDWEMCTIGDPLLDLCWILVCWPDDPDPINAGRELAVLGGLPTRTELIAAYVDAGGRPTDNLGWYVAMACFKLAIVIEGTYARVLAGQVHRDAGELLHDSASRLIGLGVRVATGDNPFG